MQKEEVPMNENRSVIFYMLLFASAVLFPIVYIPYLMNNLVGFLIILVVITVGFIIYVPIEWKKGNIPLSRKQRKQPWWIIFLFAVIELLYACSIILSPIMVSAPDTWQSAGVAFLFFIGLAGLTVWVVLASIKYIRDEE